MGLAAPAMAQDVNYKDALKPIEATLKAGNVDAKAFAKVLKEYQKEYKKDPKALVALGNALVINKDYTNALAVADAVIAKYRPVVMLISSRAISTLCRTMVVRLLLGIRIV